MCMAYKEQSRGYVKVTWDAAKAHAGGSTDGKKHECKKQPQGER